MTTTFSIVTPCLNRADTVEYAIESVLAQNYPDFEHIIVDGGSSDGTLASLARYTHLHVITEKDRNLYDAINKGLRLARGNLIGLLNTDDVYAPGAFAAMARAMEDPNVELGLGGAEIFTRQDGEETVLRRFLDVRAIGLSEANAIGNVTLINGCFWRRTLTDRIGLFDDRFPLAADKDFFMRLVLAAPRHHVITRVIYRYLSHAGSLTFSDKDMRGKLATQLLTLARTRFQESQVGTEAHAAYRRWHAWAAGYEVFQKARRGQLSIAVRTMLDALAVDPIWLPRFLARVPSHWLDRDIRRGLPSPPSPRQTGGLNGSGARG